MIASSRSAKLGAVALAVAVHAAAGLSFFRDAPVMVEGGAGAQVARVGSSFADMAAGTLNADAPDETLTPVAPAEEVATEPPLEALSATTPTEAIRVEPESLSDSGTPVLASPVTPTESIAATSQDSRVPLLSKRPVRRDPAQETPEPERTKPKPEPKQVAKKPTPPAPRGNAQTSARAGTAEGAADAKATRQATNNGAARDNGNAAASNYPGQVSRKLARTRKPRLSNRGTARVAFSISSSGGLAAVSIARSSGSSQVDGAALDLIRRAAPFPRPPAGAQRQFVVPVQFR